MLKNLIGQNLNGKAAKKAEASSSASNLLSSHSNKSKATGFRGEFKKLLHGDESKSSLSQLASNGANVKKPKVKLEQFGELKGQDQISKHQDVRQLLKDAPSFNNQKIHKGFGSPKATLLSTLSENGKKASASDIDSILGTKNIVELQRAKTTLSNSLGVQGSQEIDKATAHLEGKTPSVVKNGIQSSANLGKNVEAVMSHVEQETNHNDILKMTPDHLIKGQHKKVNIKLQGHDSNDFLMNRNVIANNSVAENVATSKMATGLHLNRFAHEAAKNNNSIIRMKPEANTIDNEVSEPTSHISRSSNQNNLIGSLGATNSTSNYRPEVKLAKSNDVIDLSNVSNADQMIKEVTNYIEMNRIENGKSLQVTVKHNDLGQFNVTANKDMNGMIALNIEATTIEAKEFFKENEVNLLKNLDMKGIRVADFKIHTATSGQMSDFASQSENFKESKRQLDKGSDKISTLESAGNDHDYARQLDSEDALDLANFKQSRESRVRRWQEFNERLGA